MIAIAVGLLLLTAVAVLVINTSRTHCELNGFSRQAENGRYASQLLSDEIHHADFYREFFDLPAPPAQLPDPCDKSLAAVSAATLLAVQGITHQRPRPLRPVSKRLIT